MGSCDLLRFAGFLGLVGIVLIGNDTLAQQTDIPANYFPASTAIYLQIDQPDQMIDKIAKHPLVESVSELKQVKKILFSPQFAMAMLAKGLIEAEIEEPLLNATKTCVSRGLALGIDSKTNGFAIVFRSSDEAKLKRLVGSILNVVAVGAKQEGQEIPFKKKKYRAAVAAEFDGFIIARYQSWFVIADKPRLARKIVDNLIDEPNGSLADQKWFQQVLRQNGAADAWLAIDLDSVRSAGVAKDLFRGSTDNPGAELVVGGIFDALKHAPVATGQLQLDQDLDFTLKLPFDAEWASKPRRFFFGQQLEGVAPAPLLPENLIANIVSYRDVADWWLSKEDLFEEAVIAQLAQADSQLSTIFSGMDFGEDVLGALQPGVQIVVTENKFDEQYLPDIKLPAFALIGKLKEPEKIRRRLRIAFQSVIGFANINLGMQGQPQLDLETERIGSTTISAAQYFYDDQTEEGLLLFNFSPTIAFQGPYLIVSSSRDLAIELAEFATKNPDGDVKDLSPTNTSVEIDARVLSRILNENRESLIANNMLEEGHGRKEAEDEIGILLAIVDMLNDGRLDFQIKPDEMRLNLQLRVKDAKVISKK
jgi:hypothetical protein